MTQETKLVWPTALVAIVLLVSALLWGFASVNSNIKDLQAPIVDLTPVVDAVNDLNDKVDTLTTSLGTTDATKLDYIYAKESESDVTEAKALELATEFVNSKDFKKLAFETLEVCTDEKCDVEEYKDITQVKIDETNVDRVGKSDTYTVEFVKVKVYYFVDGDEEETEKVLLEDFTVTVDNVDFDKNFEDAEVDDSLTTLVVAKVY